MLDATYHVLLKSVCWFRRFLKGFTIYGRGVPKAMEIGPMVPEKTFEGFLPYMGVVAILVM